MAMERTDTNTFPDRAAARPAEPGIVLQRTDEDHGGFLTDDHLDRMGEWLDTKFRLPVIGLRFGLDGVLGLIPGVGDAATAGVSAVMMADAWKSGARKRTLARMAGNVAVDFAVGTIPVVGDLFDFAFRSNVKNLQLLRDERAHLAERRRTAAT